MARCWVGVSRRFLDGVDGGGPFREVEYLDAL